MNLKLMITVNQDIGTSGACRAVQVDVTESRKEPPWT